MNNDEATIAGEITSLLGSIKDQGTEIDTGAGMGSADLWVTIGGMEWFITVRKSNNQLRREGDKSEVLA